MPNKFRMMDGKSVIVNATFTGAAYNPANAATRTITFPCKDIRSIDDVQLSCAVGYTIIPVLKVRNTVQFRVYKNQLNFTQAGGGNAVTTAAAGQNVLERAAGGPSDDAVTETPVEVANGLAVAMTVNGVAIGTI